MVSLRGRVRRIAAPFAVTLFVVWACGYAWVVWQASHTPSGHHVASPAYHKVVTVSTDERLADYTWWLAVLTGALVLTALGQGYFLLRSDRTARIAAEAARTSALKTAQMADSADKQISVMGLQTDLQMKQHAIGRLQFLAIHRPRLKVRHVNLVTTGDHIGHPDFFFTHGAEIKGVLVVVNVGGTNATIVESRYRIWASKTGLAINAPYDTDWRGDLMFNNQVLTVGESYGAAIVDKIFLEPPPPGIDHELRKFESENWVIYVMGQIRYRDEGDAERFMGFCRLRGKDRRFRAVDDPDYEYED